MRIDGLPGVPFECSQETTAKRAEIETRASAHNRRVEEIDTGRAKLRDAAGHWSPIHARESEALHAKFLSAAHEAIAIRDVRAEYFVLVEKDRCKAYSAAVIASDAAREEVKRRMIAVGFTDGPVGMHELGIEPQTLRRHPLVIAAEMEVRGAQDYSVLDSRQANENERAKVVAKLDELKRRAIAAIS